MCGNGKGGAGMNTYQVIDEKNWERAMHCMVFRESVEPAFCVTFEADITNFRRKVKAQNLYCYQHIAAHSHCKSKIIFQNIELPFPCISLTKYLILPLPNI